MESNGTTTTLPLANSMDGSTTPTSTINEDADKTVSRIKSNETMRTSHKNAMYEITNSGIDEVDDHMTDRNHYEITTSMPKFNNDTIVKIIVKEPDYEKGYCLRNMEAILTRWQVSQDKINQLSSSIFNDDTCMEIFNDLFSDINIDNPDEREKFYHNNCVDRVYDRCINFNLTHNLFYEIKSILPDGDLCSKIVKNITLESTPSCVRDLYHKFSTVWELENRSIDTIPMIYESTCETAMDKLNDKKCSHLLKLNEESCNETAKELFSDLKLSIDHIKLFNKLSSANVCEILLKTANDTKLCKNHSE